MRRGVVTAVVAVFLLSIFPNWSSYASSADAGQDQLPTGRAIVGFAPGALPEVAGGLLAGLPVGRVSRNGSFLTVAAPNLDAVRRAVAHLPGVTYVEPDVTLRALVTPSDTRFGDQYGPSMMGFPKAWADVGYGTTAVTVAVVDSGILKTHQDLAGPRILQGHDYVNNDSTPEDSCGHGTHTAGTVGATTNNGVGVAGMAQVNLLAMKALQSTLLGECSGSTAGIAQAIIDAADQGAKVISMSLGGGGTNTLQNAVNYAYGRGVILVAASGNDSQNNGVDYPAAYDKVVAVGALTSAKTRASYSDGGPQLDIAAPGSSVLSTYTGSNNATYASASGTSMATPHVAGALALALGCARPDATPTSVISALYSTADDLGAAGRDNLYGFGLARADKLVASVCDVAPPVNHNPTAAFTAASAPSFAVNVNASGSSDVDGDTLTYAWNFGDGATAAGATASHTYAGAGTYVITLTVNDGRGGTATVQKKFTAANTSQPRLLTSGQTVKVKMSDSAKNRFFRIAVPAGTSQLQAVLTGPSCNASTCPVDADLYTRLGTRPADKLFDCRSAAKGNSESCVTTNPATGEWYIRVKRISGAGTVTLKVTLS